MTILLLTVILIVIVWRATSLSSRLEAFNRRIRELEDSRTADAVKAELFSERAAKLSDRVTRLEAAQLLLQGAPTPIEPPRPTSPAAPEPTGRALLTRARPRPASSPPAAPAWR